MSTLHEHAPTDWHPGEQAIHKLLRIPPQHNPTSAGLPAPYAYRVAASPLVAVGALDAAGRPWTAVWGGEAGFARPIAPGLLGFQNLVDRRNDPVVAALFDGVPDGEVSRPEEEGGGRARLMAALSIDLATRDRVKLAGRMVVGAVAAEDGEPGGESMSQVREVQLAMGVLESLGNCPKYLNKKEIRAHMPEPRLVSDALPLPAEAIELICKADLFFLSSSNHGQSMDTNHRGGAPGFVRVLHNDAERGLVLVYPEYSGNRLYQTLGNLQAQPRVGLAVPDFDTSDVLYLTGAADILIGAAASALLPHAGLVVRITVARARFVADGLAFRGARGEASPYNPPARPLASEPGALAAPAAGPVAHAVLLRREALTPTVSRLAFALRPAADGSGSGSGFPSPPRWRAGQHVTLGFAGELDLGWSHMREDNPGSLNEDWVRTFTVSSAPAPPCGHDGGDDGPPGAAGEGEEFELTVRRRGPATRLLAAHNLRVPLELPVWGFGGEERFHIPGEDEGEVSVFVAAGVGITPLLAQAPGVLGSGVVGSGGRGGRLRVLWSLRCEDLALAVDSFARTRGLADATRLFVTGAVGDNLKGLLDKARDMGAAVETRRMERDDVLLVDEHGEANRRKYYVCTGPGLLKTLMEWLQREDVVSESFTY